MAEVGTCAGAVSGDVIISFPKWRRGIKEGKCSVIFHDGSPGEVAYFKTILLAESLDEPLFS